MGSDKTSARETAKALLQQLGLLPLAQRISTALTAPPSYRERERRFRELKRMHGDVLGARLNSDQSGQKVALLVGPSFPEAQIELGLIKGLQLAGFVPVVLVLDPGRQGRLLAEHYKLAGVKEIVHWGQFLCEAHQPTAEAIVSRFQTMWGLLEVESGGIPIGGLAVSTALRSTYRGSLDLQVPGDRQHVVGALAYAIASADAAHRTVEKFRPELAVFVDTAYSPDGELFHACLRAGVDVVDWQQGHKSNALLFKRYTLDTSHDHPASLSPESWRVIRDMEWTDEHRKQLDRELYSTYASGDWYSVVGTQFHKSLVQAAQLRERLKLDPNKKTAVIFPHILWDAALSWGKCLFGNFEEWLVETVRAASTNDQVNWVIKFHPANQRLREDGSIKESAEIASLRSQLGELPPNMIMIPPESEISTYSIFQIADYCLTVYGTVGMEAARLGIPVLTGGTGPYDRKGFTVDSNTREEYLEKVRNIHLIPRLSPAQQELAERFAYAAFLIRPWLAKSVTLRYIPSTKKFSYEGGVSIRSKEAWHSAEDIRTFAEWIADPSKPPELLAQLPVECRATNR
jgi:hypothetical protein